MPSRCSTPTEQARRPWQRHCAPGALRPAARATPSHMRTVALQASEHRVRVRGLASAPAKAPGAPACEPPGLSLRTKLQGCWSSPSGASRASGAGDAAVVAPHGQSHPPLLAAAGRATYGCPPSPPAEAHGLLRAARWAREREREREREESPRYSGAEARPRLCPESCPAHPICPLALPVATQVAPHPAEQPHRYPVSQGGTQCRRRRRSGSLEHTGLQPQTPRAAASNLPYIGLQPRRRGCSLWYVLLAGAAGLSELAGAATRLFYLSEEAREGKRAFLEKRPPRFRELLSSKL